MDIDLSPVINNVVLRRRHSDYTHFRMLAKQKAANGRQCYWLGDSDHHEIRKRSFHTLGYLRLILDLANDFNVGLVGESCEDGFAHKPRMVRHEDPDGFFHGHTPCGASIPAASERRKNQKKPTRNV